MKRLSISTRLALGYGLGLTVILGMFAAFLYAAFHVSIHRDFDRHLEHELRQVRTYVGAGGDTLALQLPSNLRAVAYQTEGVYGTYVRLLKPDRSVVYRSPNFAGHPPLPVLLPVRAVPAAVSHEWRGDPARTLVEPIIADGRLAGWLEVTGYEWSLHHELHRLGRLLALGLSLSVLLAMAGGYVLSRRALRPVAALTDTARRIGPTELGERLPVASGVRDELTDLAETFNGMLSRLERSFERERRFTDDAAHELLAPLTALRSEVEVALRRARPAEQYEETLRRLVPEVERMTAMVEGLLRLARAEHRSDPTGHERTDLAALAHEFAERVHPAFDAKGVQIDVDAPSAVWATAGPTPLGEVVANLLDNALKYTPPGGRVAVEVRAEGERACLSVADTGAGFDDETGARLFDRFFRSTQPAVQSEPGSGLGLAIVRALVTALGGDVRGTSAGAGLGAIFEVHLPAAHTSSPA